MSFNNIKKQLEAWEAQERDEYYYDMVLSEAEEFLAYEEIKDKFSELKERVEDRIFQFAKALSKATGGTFGEHCGLESVSYVGNMINVTGVHDWRGGPDYYNMQFPKDILVAGDGAVSKYTAFLKQQAALNEEIKRKQREADEKRRIEESQLRDLKELARLKAIYEK